MKKALTPLTEIERMVTDMIPGIEQITGTKQAHPCVKGAGAEKRLLFAFRQFVKAISSSERPLVLFLDDLQWAEPASLDLLFALVNDTEIQGFMVLGACRGNEVSVDHHLSITLRELEANHVAITNIEVTNLEADAINTMVSDILKCSREDCESLSELVCRQTGGNIFFVIQFLRSLLEEGLLYQDAERREWSWRAEHEILVKLKCDDAIWLVAEKMQRLPRDVLDVLMVASCFGAEFDEYLLHEVITSDVSRGIEIAEEKGLIERSYSGWRFMHDQTQQSAYSLIPEHERAEVHLQIGRKLWSALAPDELGQNTSLVVNQLRHGAHLIEDQEERDRMAVLLLRAGEKATASSAFSTAATHLNLGISMLGKRHWRDQYHLSLDLYNAAAEVEYCNANFDRMDALINEVLENARCADDKIRAFTASIYSLGSRNELQKATDLGFQVLKDLGEPFPSKGRTTTILFEFFRTKRMLQKLSDDDILNLPMMYDVNKLAALRIMNLLYAYTLNGRPRLAPLIAMRLVQTTLSGGLSGMGCVGFSAFGMLLCMAFGDVDLGIRLARVGIKVLDTFQAKEWLARVYAASYMFRFPCMEPLIAQLQPLLLSHRVELGSGDIEFAMLSAAGYAAVAWHASMPLPQLLEEMQSFLALMKLHKQTNMVQFLLPNMQLVLNMMGHSNDSVGLTGVAMKEDLAMQEAVRTQNYTVIALLHYIRLVLASYFQNYEMVEIASGKLARCKQGTDSFPFSNKASWYLHEGLSSIHIGSTPPRSRHRVGTAKRCLKKMKNVARCSPANTLNKVYLLEAEIAAGHGKIYEALEKFNDSISSAGKDNMLNEAGLACERAAMLLNRTGREKEAASFLEKAITAYDEWGAHGKGDLIRKLLSSSHYK